MDTYKLEIYGGDHFGKVANKAQAIAKNKNGLVQFDFNGIKCLVSANTSLDWLWRDYSNAHMMEWPQIGPDCLPEYESDVQAELSNRIQRREEKQEVQRKEWEAKDKVQREAYETKTSGIQFELSDEDGWNKGKANNADEYGACIYEYAEAWAKLMQVEMANGKPLSECAEPTSHELGFFGITGFMYGAAVSVLSDCWKHGEALRKWHNKEYGHEGEGVVNPAVLTMSQP